MRSTQLAGGLLRQSAAAPARSWRAAWSILIAVISVGAGRAQCVLSEAFNGPGIPSGWDIGPQVEQLDGGGNGTGSFVDAWRIGDAAEANANGFLPVPDVPAANTFIMANDDAAPCNCAMDDVALRSPLIDLSGSVNTAVEFRAYHDGLLLGGALRVEASADGTNWTVVLTASERTGQWQTLIADLGVLDGQASAFLRFTWSDNGQWATGVAIDDVCVFARADHDLGIIASMTGDPSVDPFDTGSRTLHYSQVPVAQAGPATISAILINRGAQDATQAVLHADLFLDGVPQGSFASDPIAALAPGAVDTITLNTGWTPAAASMVSAEINVSSADPDDDPSDNETAVTQWITSTGTASGNAAMAVDDGMVEGSFTLGATEGSVGNRFELTGNGGSIHAVSALVDPAGTTLGAVIQGRIMDEVLNELAETGPDTIDQADLDLAASGIPIFLMLDDPLVIDQDMDVFAMAGSVVGGAPFAIAGGGFVDRGTSVHWEPSTGTTTFLQRPPIVRLHFEPPAVGINDRPGAMRPLVHPQPAADMVHITGLHPGAWLRLLDPQGRTVMVDRSSGPNHELDASMVPAGCYRLLVGSDGAMITVPVLVAR